MLILVQIMSNSRLLGSSLGHPEQLCTQISFNNIISMNELTSSV